MARSGFRVAGLELSAEGGGLTVFSIPLEIGKPCEVPPCCTPLHSTAAASSFVRDGLNPKPFNLNPKP